jgi:hypothetical protein
MRAATDLDAAARLKRVYGIKLRSFDNILERTECQAPTWVLV